ncbi:MAG: acyltransferase [Colwellia sp.]
MKLLFQLLTVFLPSSFKVFLYRRLLNWDIHPSVKIGFSLLLCENLVMEKDSCIRSLTLIKGLSLLRMGESSSLGSLNWVTAFPLGPSRHFSKDPNRQTTLHIKEHGAITNRHLIDCTDSVTIGRYTTFAGFRSQILTHSINLKEARQRCLPVEVGDYCFVGTGSILLPGAKLPCKSILAAGAVLSDNLIDEGYLYGGVPTKKIKHLDLDDYEYMNRSCGYIW